MERSKHAHSSVTEFNIQTAASQCLLIRILLPSFLSTPNYCSSLRFLIFILFTFDTLAAYFLEFMHDQTTIYAADHTALGSE